MEHKTTVHAEAGKQELVITRTFDLPVELLYKAYTEAELVEQWMGNKVLKLENRAHGGYAFETRNAEGNVVFKANGTIHSVLENCSIVRTFEMESMGFAAQLEFLDFEAVDANESRLTKKLIFKSVEDRDNLLKMPFEYGINMAHNALQQLMNKPQ